MLTAQDLRKITDENRVKLLLEAKEELMNNIIAYANLGNNQYYMDIRDSYLCVKNFTLTADEISSITKELRELGYKIKQESLYNIISW